MTIKNTVFWDVVTSIGGCSSDMILLVVYLKVFMTVEQNLLPVVWFLLMFMVQLGF